MYVLCPTDHDSVLLDATVTFLCFCIDDLHIYINVTANFTHRA